LKFPAANGRQLLTDPATAETLLRLVQSRNQAGQEFANLTNNMLIILTFLASS
jgi:hypothetical protein